MKNTKQRVKSALLVFVGGFWGVLFRAAIVMLLSGQIDNIFWTHILGSEITTLVVNLIACFAAGFLANKLEDENHRLLIIVGFLGGLSTVSSITLTYASAPSFLMVESLAFLMANFLLGLLAAIIAMNLQSRKGKKK